jgi:hypothetical protein
MTAEEIQAAIDQIRGWMAAGALVKSMTFAEQTFVFNDFSDMEARLEYLEGLLMTVNGTAAPGYRVAATSKGV